MSNFKIKMLRIWYGWGSPQTLLGELTALPRLDYLLLKGGRPGRKGRRGKGIGEGNCTVLKIP